MDIRALTSTYAVSPQITVSDLTQIRKAGYTTVVDNRPDSEIPSDIQTDAMRAAVAAAGLEFVANPIIGGMLTPENVAAQAAAIQAATGPVLAYCASGNRSSIVWALVHAGKMPTNDLIAIPARFGYNLEGLRGQLEALAAKN